MSDIKEIVQNYITGVKIINNFEFLQYKCIFRTFATPQTYHIYIPQKKIYLGCDLLNEFLKTREQMTVGYQRGSEGPNKFITKDVDMYEDGDYFHIGCEKVEKRIFIKEFINIKKQINGQHNSNIKEETAK